MTKVQVVENESFLQYADFDNCEVWLLNRTNEEKLDKRIINIPEITEGFEPSSLKFPKLLTEIYNVHPVKECFDEKGNIIDVYVTFDYEILTDNMENYAIHSYVCDTDKIKVVQLINYGTESSKEY